MTSGVARALAVYPSDLGSELRSDAVDQAGFAVRAEIEAGPRLNGCSYDVRLLVRNLARVASVTTVRPSRFSGRVNDGVHWLGQSSEFVFTVDRGEFEPGDVLEAIVALRVCRGPEALYATMRSCAFQVADGVDPGGVDD